ncbi:PepSY domain-containing protein [Steroidobacter cummioxidans]|uniref:PepSY domain-containing protein n=1 Tax=Steroidobacter cummioxidans TaxID=1803913 RepID=UPI000E3212B5|nr:PepSY domain-containing protein [Steroidobacter cummioxidans]
MKSRFLVACALLLGTLSFGVSTGLADKQDRKREQHTLVREALQRGEVLPLVKILEIANQQVPGDVIEVELENKKEALIYEIKILTGTGRVREVKIDARTGAVVKVEDD